MAKNAAMAKVRRMEIRSPISMWAPNEGDGLIIVVFEKPLFY